MEGYSNVTLVKIVEERVVVIDGEEFLIVDRVVMNALKSKYVPRPYTNTNEMKNAICEILKQHPGSASKDIRHFLDKDFNIQPTKEVMRGCLQRMRESKQIMSKGVKNQAVWFLLS